MYGIYVVVLELKKGARIEVGALGSTAFVPGYYCYVGSAIGGNLSVERRIRRHLRVSREGNVRRWHIDHLLTHESSSIIEVWIKPSKDKTGACKVASKLRASFTGLHPSRFGSSDCNCNGHLIYVEHDIDELRNALAKCGFNRTWFRSRSGWPS